jgi:hypothetical protein
MGLFGICECADRKRIYFGECAALASERISTAKLFNLLKPTGHVTHHQFNIQQLHALPTLYLCVLYLSENKQLLVPLTAQTDWFL